MEEKIQKTERELEEWTEKSVLPELRSNSSKLTEISQHMERLQSEVADLIVSPRLMMKGLGILLWTESMSMPYVLTESYPD